MLYFGLLAAIFSAVSWAFGTVMFERIGKTIPFVGITFLKGTFSIVLMIALLLSTGGLQAIGLHEFAYLSLSGVIGISIGDSLFFKSLQDLGAKVQVIFFLLGQILTMILSLLLLGELLTTLQYIGSSILLAGIVTVIWGKQEDRPNKLRGILFGLLSILCFSISVIMVKMSISHIEAITATFYRMVFGTFFTLGFGMARKEFMTWIRPLKDIKLLSMFAINVIVITYGGFLLSIVAIKYISVALASILGTMEPVFVLLFAFLLNGEKACRRELFGTLLTLLGLYLIVH